MSGKKFTTLFPGDAYPEDTSDDDTLLANMAPEEYTQEIIRRHFAWMDSLPTTLPAPNSPEADVHFENLIKQNEALQRSRSN